MEELDLHWVDEDPDLGIASEGVLCKNMDEIIARITEVKNTVKKINFDNQSALTEIPAVLGECGLLEEINISHTRVKEIPGFLLTLPNLRSLSCRCSELAQFPKKIAGAKKLETLSFRINEGCSFPQEISSMQSLKNIYVDFYSAAALPENLGGLKNLEKLYLFIKYDEGNIPVLPSSFKNNPSLKTLSVKDLFYRKRKNFDLDSAIQILSSCEKLEILKLSGIAVGEGHQHLSELKGLKHLELRHLLVKGNVFDSITSLTNLEILDILGSEFKIMSMPDIFMNFKNLREFYFAGNMITELPPSIYNLPKLEKLEIGSTGISMLSEKAANLQNLDTLHVYDSLLGKLPQAIFVLPRLQVLNIEENIFNPSEITAIKQKLAALEQKGQKIQFVCEGQGHRQMVKKLRAINNNAKLIDSMNAAVYAKHCLNAAKENPFAIKYVNKNKLQDSKFYAEICAASVRQTASALENIDPELLGETFYPFICMEAAKAADIGNAFKLIMGDLLSDKDYIKVCVEAALHNRQSDFINNFNNDTFMKRFSREIYERICWVAVLNNHAVISKVKNPPPDIRFIAEKFRQNR